MTCCRYNQHFLTWCKPLGSVFFFGHFMVREEGVQVFCWKNIGASDTLIVFMNLHYIVED
ncbi:hypothetical protein DEU73_101360 [Paenibacillus taichungensis]|nr:hypothetical protein DEU73_101360 [Paenibacillus taichungensis]